MDILLQNQETLMGILRAVLFLCCLIVVIIMALFNMLYLIKMLNANKRVGIHPPKHIHHLLRASLFLSVFTGCFIVVFLVLGLT
jgi:hypothetical protein